MVPAREWPWVREQADLVGTYWLWRACDYPLLASSATVRIALQDGDRFVLGIPYPTGNEATDWVGHGRIDGRRGHFYWTFRDGKLSRATFVIDEEGNLRGQVHGGGIDGDFVGKRLEGPVKMPRR
jgi:hypothetical protein